MRQPRLVETSGYQARDVEQKVKDAEQPVGMLSSSGVL